MTSGVRFLFENVAILLFIAHTLPPLASPHLCLSFLCKKKKSFRLLFYSCEKFIACTYVQFESCNNIPKYKYVLSLLSLLLWQRVLLLMLVLLLLPFTIGVCNNSSNIRCIHFHSSHAKWMNMLLRWAIQSSVRDNMILLFIFSATQRNWLNFDWILNWFNWLLPIP